MNDVDSTLTAAALAATVKPEETIEVEVHFVWDADGNVEVHTDGIDAMSNFYENNSPDGLVWSNKIKVKLPKPKTFDNTQVTIGLPAPHTAGKIDAAGVEVGSTELAVNRDEDY